MSLIPPLEAERQNVFHRAVTRFINGGHGWRPGSGAAVRPGTLILSYAQLGDAAPASVKAVEANVETYAGENPYVQQLSSYLSRELANDLVGAYVHGSLGSYEEIAYSDFDALVILRDEVFQSPTRLARVARALDRARAFMYTHDPLQHHGWFVLTEIDLRSYCEAYFPSVLFRHAKSLLPGQGERLTLYLRDSSGEALEAFRSLSSAVVAQLEHGRLPANLYALKNLLSQFMLLPSLYVQVRDEEGVWKADSFARAREDFSRTEWSSMEAASRIRQVWSCRLPAAQRRLMASTRPWGGYLRKHLPTPIPPPIAALLTPRFFSGMTELVAQMQRRVEAFRPLLEPAGTAS